MPFTIYSIEKVPKVTSPVLVIHGTEDEVIDFSHGLTIYEKCPRAVEPLWVEVGQTFKKSKVVRHKTISLNTLINSRERDIMTLKCIRNIWRG